MRRTLPVVATLATVALACATAQVSVHAPARVVRLGTGAFQVGAGRADLTPIPGIPLGGYSVASKISRGFWGRLEARAIYLEDTQLRPLVLVSTDLMIMPNGLAARVVELLHASDPSAVASTPLTWIGLDNLILAATETHQSPGNFFTAKLYNEFSSPRSGFDPELFEFLALRISRAVRDAWSSRQPALIRTSHSTALPAKLPGFFRNRSMDAFWLNRDASKVLDPALPPCPLATFPQPSLYPDPRACQAVHARVDFLAFVSAAAPGSVIALAVFLAGHTTILPSETEVYSADLFGAAALRLESALRNDPSCAGGASAAPVVALFQGAQGDVSLTWRERDRGDLLGHADTLVQHVCNRLPGQPMAATDVDLAFDVTHVDAQPFGEAMAAGVYPRSTDANPSAGVGELGGAEDGRTIFHELGQQEGTRDFVRREDGMKATPLQLEAPGGGNPLDPIGLTLRMIAPPRRVPLGYYRLGGVVLVTLPGEFTTAMGFRIREGVAKAAGVTADHVFFVGFGNGHLSYVTTPEEYDRQTYEGASNYWGPGAGPFLAAHIEALTVSGVTTPGVPPPWQDPPTVYEVGTKRVFEPRDAWGPPWNPDDGLAAIVQDPATHLPRRDYPTFCWHDAIPSLAVGSPACARVLPEVAIRVVGQSDPLEVASVSQTNRGLDLVTVMVGVSQSQTEWCAIWMAPAATPAAGPYEFLVRPIDPAQAQLVSPPFPTTHADEPVRPMTPLVPNDGTSLWCSPLLNGLGLCSQTCRAGG